MAVETNKMERFFRDNLKQNETIFVFAGLRLPYLAAKRFSGKNITNFFQPVSNKNKVVLNNYLLGNFQYIYVSIPCCPGQLYTQSYLG